MKTGLRNNLRLDSVPISQKSNKGANSVSLSLNSQNVFENNFFNNSPNNDLSFTGVDTFVKKQASNLYSNGQSFLKKYVFDEDIVVKNYGKFLEKTNIFVGDGFIEKYVNDFQNLMGSKASEYINVSGDVLRVRDRRIASKLKDGFIDVAHLPIDLAGALVRGISKLPFIRNTRAADSLNNISFIKKRADKKAAMDIYYRLKGMVEYSDDVPALRKKILGVPAGKPVGNYNTKDERALNRLATGFVSAMFVGNDFYNLIMYEKNDKKEAQKAGKKRRNREIFRIAVNAFTTYAVLGALSSYINGKMVAACAAIAGSSLFAEVITRIVTGVPLHPLSPEGAKKYNKKKALKEEKKAKRREIFGAANKTEPANESKNSASQALKNEPSKSVLTSNGASFNTNMKADDNIDNVFDKFRDPKNFSENLLNQNETQKWQGAFKGEENKTNKNDNKSNPITIKRVLIGIGAVLAADLLYGMARSKVPGFNKLILDSGKKLKKLYKNLAYEDLLVKDKDLRKFLTGFEGTKMDSLKQAYARILDVEFTEEEARALLSASKGGIIKIGKYNKIYNGAYVRTAKAGIDTLYKKQEGKYMTKALKKLKREPEILAFGPEDLVKKSGKQTKKMSQNFIQAQFEIDMSEPFISSNGTKYYKMKNAEFNFGQIKETKWKVFIDAFSYPFKALKNLVKLPAAPLKKIANYEPPKPKKTVIKKGKDVFEMPDLGELYRDCTTMFKRYQKGIISKEEFRKYIHRVNTNPLNSDTIPKYPQASLASVSRTFVTLISSYFFVNDFRNEVLIQSNGENTEKASEVTKERAAHKLSNFVLNKFFMDLFNNTFNKQLLGSLAGATTVAAATELTNESCVRLSIGVPLKPMESKEAIDEFEKKHLEQKGIKGAYYRTMARITGKKMLSEKAEKK